TSAASTYSKRPRSCTGRRPTAVRTASRKAALSPYTRTVCVRVVMRGSLPSLEPVETAVLARRLALAGLHPLHRGHEDEQQPDEVAAGPDEATADLLLEHRLGA